MAKLYGLEPLIPEEVPGVLGIAEAGDDHVAFVRVSVQGIQAVAFPDDAGPADLIQAELHQLPDGTVLIPPQFDVQVRPPEG